MGTEAPEEENVKKGRHRKKLLYSSILQQMEFYFSDANLAKDRFLSALTKENPYVDITVFLKFNKLIKLTTSIKDITKALGKSQLLELSEDKTKVKRRNPITEKTNVDECTLYVERLKSDATHDWLTAIFSDFGNVTYVSIPKYKLNGMIKGFAFVEFQSEESVQAALQYFDEIGCKIPSCMEPDQLCSIVAYKQETSEDFVEEPPKKKPKLDKPEEESEGDKSKKKQKKANKKKAMLKEIGLQILSKKDWKKMRNRYLDMQRKSMKNLKMHLNRQRFAQKYDKANPNPACKSEEKDKESKEAEVLEQIANVIVQVELPEVCYTPKVMRKKVKSYSSDIKYVDIPFGSSKAFVRFNESKSAEEFCLGEFKDRASLLQGEEETEYWNKIKESAAIKRDKVTKAVKKRGRDKLLKRAEKHAVEHIRFNEENLE